VNDKNNWNEEGGDKNKIKEMTVVIGKREGARKREKMRTTKALRFVFSLRL
jgi:hypothetical protein